MKIPIYPETYFLNIDEGIHPEMREDIAEQKKRDLQWFDQNPGAEAMMRSPTKAERALTRTQGKEATHVQVYFLQGDVITGVHFEGSPYHGEPKKLFIELIPRKERKRGRAKPRGF